MPVKQSLWTLCLAAMALLSIVLIGVQQYGGNVSALLHVDIRFAKDHDVPAGIVLYEDAGYDGMLYYQVARDIPAFFSGEKTSLDSPYRFQRILFPLLAYSATFGNDRALPYAFLVINLAAAIGALALAFAITKKINVHSLAMVANPAVLVGILFSLTEPLSLFFIVLFFYAWQRNNQKLNVLSISVLALSLFTRETTVFLIGLLFLWFLWRKQWKQALLIVIPILLLLLWQYFLVLHLGSVAFQANSNVIDFPFGGPLKLIEWSLQDVNAYRLSALSLLAFLILLCTALGKEWTEKKQKIDVLCFLLSGLCATMLMMDAHIWGVITSIGRVVTPIYPVYVLYAAARDTWIERTLSVLLMAIGIVTALGISLIRHPFITS